MRFANYARAEETRTIAEQMNDVTAKAATRRKRSDQRVKELVGLLKKMEAGPKASREQALRQIAKLSDKDLRLLREALPKNDPRRRYLEAIVAYYKHTRAYYGFEADKRRGDRYCLRDALRVVKLLYGRTPARDFGPKALKACRQHMVGKDWLDVFSSGAA